MQKITRTLLNAALTLLVVAGGTSAVRAQQTGPVFHADDQQLVNVLPPDTVGGPHLVAILEGNPGDVMRINPDGTVQIVLADADVPVLLVDDNPLVDPDSNINILLGGSGRLSLSAMVAFDQATGFFFPTGERTQIKLDATLAQAPDAAPEATAWFQLVEEHQNVRISQFEIEPIE